jgi:hypothetical protein
VFAVYNDVEREILDLLILEGMIVFVLLKISTEIFGV